VPADLRVIIDRIKQGEVRLVIDEQELRKLFQNLEHTNNRLTVAIVLAAILVSSSLIIIAAPTGLKGTGTYYWHRRVFNCCRTRTLADDFNSAQR
jgi:hypothetical protein